MPGNIEFKLEYCKKTIILYNTEYDLIFRLTYDDITSEIILEIKNIDFY